MTVDEQARALPGIGEEAGEHGMIRVENVSKRYRLRGKEVAALADVNLSIATGEFVAMVGPSGSGKSTLLLALGGLIHPNQGEVYLDGQALYRMDQAGRARILFAA